VTKILEGKYDDRSADSLPSATTSRGTQLSAPSLPGNVRDLLMSGESPIVGPKTAQMLSAFADLPSLQRRIAHRSR
jgi:hypothetical protein